MVELRRFELLTSSLRTTRSAKLSYSPTKLANFDDRNLFADCQVYAPKKGKFFKKSY